jgi:hypothetical protein
VRERERERKREREREREKQRHQCNFVTLIFNAFFVRVRVIVEGCSVRKKNAIFTRLLYGTYFTRSIRNSAS